MLKASLATKNHINTSKKAIIEGINLLSFTTNTVLIVPKLTSKIRAKNIFKHVINKKTTYLFSSMVKIIKNTITITIINKPKILFSFSSRYSTLLL